MKQYNLWQRISNRTMVVCCGFSEASDAVPVEMIIIIACVCGAVVIILIIIIAVLLCRRCRSKSQFSRQSTACHRLS